MGLQLMSALCFHHARKQSLYFLLVVMYGLFAWATALHGTFVTLAREGIGIGVVTISPWVVGWANAIFTQVIRAHLPE